jgi:hypothetical protein
VFSALRRASVTVALASGLAACIDGTTPNCQGEAGAVCGPGIEAGDTNFFPDALDAGTARDAGHDATLDAGSGDAGVDTGASTDSGGTVDAPAEATTPADATGSEAAVEAGAGDATMDAPTTG